jgi:hypothetical protein
MGKKFFFNVLRGSFSEKPVPEQNSFSCNEITGYLVNIVFKETAYGDAMRLHVVDENNFYMLSIFVESRPATAFFMMAKNLDLRHEMTFKIKHVDGKDYFSIHQFGGPVLWYYTKENQHELPLLNEDRRPFLKQIVEDEIIPSLQKQINPYPNNPVYRPMRKGLQGGYFDEYSIYANRNKRR